MYPAKLSFMIEVEIKTFHKKQKLKEFMTTESALQEINKGINTQKRKIMKPENYRNE
jgi:hypothetical protein